MHLAMPRLLLVLLLTPLMNLTLLAQVPESASPPAEVNKRLEKTETSNARFIEAINRGDIVEVLDRLDHGASPDTNDEHGSPALCLAVRINRVDIVEVLLARGAKVDEKGDHEGTALQLAAGSGRAGLVKLLIANGADVNARNKGGLMDAAYGVALKETPVWLLEELFDKEAEKIVAMGDEHLTVVKLLLKAGADVNAQAEDCGLTALMIAAMSGKVELGQILLTAGAKVDIGGEDLSALKFAEMGETPEDLEKMLDDESDDKSRQAVLNWWHLTRPGRREFAALLKKAGARN